MTSLMFKHLLHPSQVREKNKQGKWKWGKEKLGVLEVGGKRKWGKWNLGKGEVGKRGIGQQERRREWDKSGGGNVEKGSY